MTTKTFAVALALTLAPALSYAEGCNYSKQAMSCAAGSTYDADSKSCVPATG